MVKVNTVVDKDDFGKTTRKHKNKRRETNIFQVIGVTGIKGFIAVRGATKVIGVNGS